MLLHNLHNEPTSFEHYDDVDLVPLLAWEKYKHNPQEMKKREKLWAKDPQTAFDYAERFLKGRFKLGEPAIAKDAKISFYYAVDVLNARFKLGEPAIAKDPHYSEIYQRFIKDVSINE